MLGTIPIKTRAAALSTFCVPGRMGMKTGLISALMESGTLLLRREAPDQLQS